MFRLSVGAKMLICCNYSGGNDGFCKCDVLMYVDLCNIVANESHAFVDWCGAHGGGDAYHLFFSGLGPPSIGFEPEPNTGSRGRLWILV